LNEDKVTWDRENHLFYETTGKLNKLNVDKLSHKLGREL
jgi:hypothetical protein